MSRSLWRCRNLACQVPHGTILGHLTADGSLVLSLTVTRFRCYLDTRRAVICCPSCGAKRDYRGGAVFSGWIE